MVRVKKKVETCSVRCLVYHHHHDVGIVSMKPRVSVALASRENVVVRSDGNGLVYQEGVELFD